MKNQKNPQSLIEILVKQKNNRQKGITFINSGSSEVFLSYHELYTTALSLLGYLQDNGLKQGDELVFQVEDNKTFICFFWASILGGIVPIPVSVAHHAETVEKLWRIKNILNNPYLLISEVNYGKLLTHNSFDEHNKSDEKSFVKVLFTNTAGGITRNGKIQSATPDQIAFVQFSSGSTGNPKGVVLTHANVLANINSAWISNEFLVKDKFLSWMPLTHDMGLIGFHLYPFAHGANHYIMPTDLFIRNPLLWLKKVSGHRATVICSPNFGYKYYLNQFKEEHSIGLDLASVRIIFNGAEPIAASLTRHFTATLACAHLNPLAMRAVYGLAEATLQVSYPQPGASFQSIHILREMLTIGSRISTVESSKENDLSLEVVNVGKPITGMAVKIARENEEELAEGHVGIVWIKGNSVTSRYYNNVSATQAVIRNDGWLNTGDTGFFLDGFLYVVGRVKDIIFVNGSNVYPHDIERTIESLEGIESGKVVACGVQNHETESESIVVFVLNKAPLEKFVLLAGTIKKFIASRLGLEIMHVIPVRKILKTTSGKVKRHLFREEYRKGAYAEVLRQMKDVSEKDVVTVAASMDNSNVDKIQNWLRQWLRQKLDLKVEDIAVDETFAACGMTSFQAVAMVNEIENFFGITVATTAVYNFPTIRTLSNHLADMVSALKEGDDKDVDQSSNAIDNHEIAVIGMGCRFPGNSSTPEMFWSFLNAGKSAIRRVPEERWDVEAFYNKDENAAGKMYTDQGGFIDGVDQFDPSFFGISPKEAACMDPQQRLLLEVCWEALEHAGLCPSKLRGSDSGIFIGMGTDDYEHIIHNANDKTYFNDAFSGLGIERSIAAGRIAYLLDFHGPVVQLDTACSSSLLSIHQACQNLLLKECSLALAGGVNLMLAPETTVKLCQMKALSPSGLCQTFDDEADGYVRGEGAGIVVLKRLCDALRDGDTILAVIKGSAVNHDGLSNGLTAPNGMAQQQLIQKALVNAKLDSGSIQYVEVHGTGTRLGDPVELHALNAVYGQSRSKADPLLVGAVKTNIGHLEAASGIAGFIKTILCLQNKMIPVNLNYTTPNRFIPWNEMALQVVSKPTSWDISTDERRRAAVSAFGLSGTNVHVILEEAGCVNDHVNIGCSEIDYPSYPIVLSGKTPEALQALAKNYSAWLLTSPASLSAMSYSTAVSRDSYPYRFAIEATSKQEAHNKLKEYGNKPVTINGSVQSTKKNIVWLFTGQGSQYWNMGKELYDSNAVFKNIIDRCDVFLKKHWAVSLVELLYERSEDEANALLKQTAYTQPALFAIECALAEVWKSWGICPSAVLGHSVGEYAAAYVAGVFSLDDGLQLVTERAQLMQSVKEEGSMAVVFASEDLVTARIKPYGNHLAIAAVNGASLIVISGKKSAVDTVLESFKEDGVRSKLLSVSHAFHSPLMESVVDAFEKFARRINYSAPTIPLISNVTGELITNDIKHASYWSRHMLAPVLFSKSISTINENDDTILIEIGPQPSLLTMVKLNGPYPEDCLLPSMQIGHSSWRVMLQSLTDLYVKGVQIDWNNFYRSSRQHKIHLPTYPFQRKRYWIDNTIVPKNEDPLSMKNKKKPLDNTSAILEDLAAVFGELLKTPAAEINIHTPFLELGADSMVLASAVRRIEKRYSTNFSIRQLFEELNTLHRMASHIAKSMPFSLSANGESEGADAKALSAPVLNETAGTRMDVLNDAKLATALQPSLVKDSAAMIQRQLDVMEQLIKLQLQQLGSTPSARNHAVEMQTSATNGHHSEVSIKQPVIIKNEKRSNHQSIFPKIEKASDKTGLTQQQQAYLDEFICRYTEKTKTSKQLTQHYRSVLADNRLSVGFRFSTKELHYPLQIASSLGSKITDVDGNEYIDLTMGFGVSLLGHRPTVVTNAVQQQLNTGFQLGPQSPLTGEVASKIAKLTGMDRVSFHNSGTEAVMTAIRLARAVTGRKKIAIFKGAYHGHFDGTLAVIEDLETNHQGVPLTLGIVDNMVADVLMFDYTNATVVQQLKSYAHELAAVLVEPVQSRNPGYQPQALLKELRAMTSDENIVLIFDEMITGFRIHPGGAQAYFGIEADLATYGKVAGGGLPIGIIAGKRCFMDVLDGGNWQYGDQSYPQIDTTYFAGTFCKHPLSMAASLALLTELERQGPALQEQLNKRTKNLVDDIAAIFQENEVPIEIHNFGSLFHFSATKNMDLFFYHLIEKGVYVWEGRTSFLSTAHTDADINFILLAIRESVSDLQHAGFLSQPPHGPDHEPLTRKQLNDRPSIASDVSSDRIPLSFSQERLWIVDKMEGSLAYHEPAVYNVKGVLNKTALERALQTIVNRHESLRTVIEECDGKPYQRVLPADQWKLIVQKDISDVKEHIAVLIHTPFNLSADFMLRAQLIQMTDDEHVLVLILHHIAFDAWSEDIILRELVALYEAYDANHDITLNPLRVHYTDYAQRQRSCLTDEILAGKLDYWKDKLNGLEPLNMPVDFAHPVVQHKRSRVVHVDMDDALMASLRQLSQKHGVTLFMTLLTTAKVLLYRYSGQKDICVGTTIAGRMEEDLENLVGFFVNTLALRSNLTNNPSFITLLQQVKETVLEAYEHQDVPFEKVVDAVVMNRSLHQSPLFQTMFVLQNTPDVPVINLGAASLIPEVIEEKIAKFDLTFSFIENQAHSFLSLEYNTDVYTVATVEKLGAHYKALLTSLVKDPMQKIGNLAMLSTSEKQQLVLGFNDTHVDYPHDKTVVDLFEEQVLKNPEATAVVFENKALTYAALSTQSNQLAHYLAEKGIKRENRVAVCLERSLEMIVALLGVLKAGAAYVPIDTDYPNDRIDYLLSDSDATVILTSKKLASLFIENKSNLVIRLDEDWPSIARCPIEKFEVDLRPENLMYVMHTSGSTGKPKGVMVEHTNVVRLVRNVNYITLSPSSKVLQAGAFSFDATTFEIWGMLLNGGEIHLTSRHNLTDLNYLKSYIKNQNISCMFFTTAWFHQIVDTDVSVFEFLETVMTGGEKLSPKHVAIIKAAYPSLNVINFYGPTENTTFSTFYKIEQTQFDSVPIGKPISNSTVYILSADGELVPPGVTGEIYTGGFGVARGYLNKPDLTKEKFITDSFSDRAGAMLYKTGDLGFWQPDGTIAFIGRIDDQVKIRGYRIELAEIEDVLQKQEGIGQCVVVAREDESGEKRLIGYVVKEEGFDKKKILRRLQSELPEYMVPSIIIDLEAFPLTANSKIDKKALPVPDFTELLERYVAPRNLLEKKMAAIWQELLKVERVGLLDNFFSLGGHSLLATRLVSSLVHELSIEVSIKDVFAYPVLGNLCEYLEHHNKSVGLPVVGKDSDQSQMPLSYAQERLWFMDELQGSIAYHMPAVFSVKGAINRDALQYAIQEIINRHEVLRTVVKQNDGLAYQYIKQKDCWRLMFTDLRQSGENLESIIRQCIDRPFNLSNDDMVRCHLVQLSSEEFKLILVIHHIVADGWSVPLFIQELTELYTSKIERRGAILPELHVQYSDFSKWQRTHLNARIEIDLMYWEKQLSDVSTLSLPVDAVIPTAKQGRGATQSFMIEKELSNALEALSKKDGATLFMGFLAILNVLLYRYSGQEDICIGTPVAGRTRKEVEPLIGLFVNTLAVRSDLRNNPGFNTFLQRIKNITLEAYEHQLVPFEKVVEHVNVERDLSRSPLFQVMFVMQDAPEISSFDLGDVTLTIDPVENTTAKFDLTFTAVEKASGWCMEVEYDTNLFAASTITRLMVHYKNLLVSAVENPTKAIGNLSMLSAAEERQILNDFNDTKVVYPLDKTIVDLYEAQASSNPDEVAIIFEGRKLTYREVNEKSNQLAFYLRDQYQIKADDLIAILADRSERMMIGILGILKSGAGYVPIDPEYPRERIAYMISDSQPKTILVDTKDALNNFEFKEWIDLEIVMGILATYPKENLPSISNAGSIAYVMYTSGSTGNPKGVIIEHRNLLNYLYWTNSFYFDNQRGNQFAAFTSLSFDLSVTGFFSGLLRRDPVYLWGTNESSEMLEQIFNHPEVRSVKLTPSHIGMIEHLDKIKESQIACAIVGGEALLDAHVRTLQRINPKMKIYNEYGPTETTVGCTVEKVNDSKNISIGKPIANTHIYILDTNLSMVPLGVPGEIYVGGAGVARGYFNRKELTEEKFIVNPFDEKSGKLYKTGDLGKWLSDGSIAYMGRRDDQVKIRGYRIELGEIENVLQKCEGVLQCLVTVSDVKGKKQLVGYVVLRDNIDTQIVQDFLRTQLPEYMVPSLLIRLSEMPLTSNGKVNKKALPGVEAFTNNHVEYVAPRTHTENKLAEIWQVLLNIDKISIHDNFFALGGDSIMTIQVVSRAKREGLHFTPRDIFHHQTIAELATIVKQNAVVNSEQGLLSGEAGLLPIQQWFFEQGHADNSHYNQAVLLQLDKKVTQQQLEKAMVILMNHHDALRFTYATEGGIWKQYYGMNHGCLIVDDLQTVPAEQLSQTITQHSDRYQRALNIEHHGELVKVVLMKTPASSQYNRLLLVIHHLAVDGVSWRIILEDIENMLNAETGSQLALGLKTSSYREWFDALTAFAQTKTVENEQSFWCAAVNEYKPLPTDRFADKVFMKSVKEYQAELSIPLTNALLKDVHQTFNTGINDILLSALALTISKWSKHDKVIVGLEGHGRQHISDKIDVSRTVGWFTTINPVLLIVEQGQSNDDLIKSIKQQVKQVPLHGIGYGLLRYLHPNENNRKQLSALENPWDLVFNYLGQLDTVTSSSRWLSDAPEYVGVSVGENNVFRNKLEINCSIRHGRLEVSWSYSNDHYNDETIIELANQYMVNLGNLIIHCQHSVNKEYSLLDYGVLPTSGLKEIAKNYDVEDIYPLSPMQEGFLFYSLMDSGAQTYFIQTSIPFIGNLNVDLVKESFTIVMQRNAILRTAFVHEDSSVPLQVVTRKREVDFEFIDVMNLPEGEKLAYIQQVKDKDKNRLFTLAKDVLMRIKVIHTAKDQFEFVLSTHHIIMDGWCFGIIMTEFFEIYYSLCQHQQPKLTDVKPYKNYIQWLASKDKNVSQDFWRNYLDGYSQLSGVPRQISQGSSSTYKHKLISIFLGDQRTYALNKLAQKNKVTFNTLVQTAWGILVSKYNGKRDTVYGAVVSGRSPQVDGIESMVGLFINTIPVRVIYTETTRVTDLLQRVQNDSLENENHQYFPLAEIQNQSSLKQNLLDHVMVMASYPLDKKFINAEHIDENIRIKVDVSSLQSFEQTNYDFNIMVHPGESVRIDFGFNENVYDLPYMECIQNHFVTLLDSIVQNENGIVDDLVFLTKQEEDRILFEFNDTAVSYPTNKTIHALFEDQVRSNPQATALLCNGRSMSYLELNQRSNQWAHYLRHMHGVKPDEIVALMPTRDETMIIALLGILKAGAAYLPIDPEIPVNRIDYILSNAKVSLILTCSDYREQIKNAECDVLLLDEPVDLDLFSIENPDPVCQPDNLAYVIYTSGSTGQPKGVMINHRSNVNMSLDQVRKFDIQAGDVVLQFASLSFDASISEICMAFYAGASLVLIDKVIIKDQTAFLKYIKKHDVNVVTLPPSYLSVLPLAELEFLKVIITAGEAPKIQDVLFLHTRINYYNAYGPTECAVCVSINKVDHIDDQSNTLSIGSPIANYRCYIVNDLMQPLPIGMVGEICVAGIGLARGYLNNDELTRQKFVTSPFVKEAVLYKTGDLGRWLPDGKIEFVGRKDTQVKVRGYRVELGEIENTILRHPKIQDCAVLSGRQHDEIGITAYMIQKKQIELWPSLSEYFVYDEILYNTMANDELRNEKYKNAFRKVLKDKVVLEIGPGKEAILARLAIEEGAKKVYAVEILEESYLQAKETIKKYGLEDKVTVILGDITKVKLPEPVDYCISEIVGPIGGSEGSAKLINAARNLLKNPSCMIPSRSLTSIAAITLPEGEFDSTFEEVGAYYVSKVFEQVGYKFDLRLCLHNFPKKNVISSHDILEDLDYTVENELESVHEIFLEIQRDAVFHGFIVWLNLYCDDDEVINTLENKFIWLPVYFPVLAQGVSLKQGDSIRATVYRTLCDNELNPDFTIEGVINTGNEGGIPFVYNSYHNASIYQENEFYRKLFSENDLRITQELSKVDVRNFLAENLPEYMVPSRFYFMEKFPMNNSGKIDRSALAATHTSTGNNSDYVAPRNAIETMLTMIWEDVLEVKKVGVLDNFFDLGGHSLKAIQTKTRMDQLFETAVDLKYIFNFPTIESLAKAIGEGLTKKTSCMLQLNRIQENNNDVFCLPPSIGTSIVYKGLAEKLEGKLNCFGLQCKGIDDDELLEETMGELARTFVAEIINARPSDEYTLVGYSFGGSLIFEMAKQLETLGKKVKLINIDKGIDLEFSDQNLISGEEFDKAAEETLGFWYKSLQNSDLVMRSKNVNEKLLKLEHDYIKEGSIKADYLALESLDNEKPNHLEDWSAYVTGTFTHVYLKGNHLQLLDSAYLPETSSAIEQWLGVEEKINLGYSLFSNVGK